MASTAPARAARRSAAPGASPVVRQRLLAKVASRLEEDPQHVAPILRLIAEPDVVPPRERLSGEAKEINTRRLAARRAAFIEGAFSGQQVRELLGGVSRQAVHQKTQAGRLLAVRYGNTTWFPKWQFTADGRILPRLGELLAVLPADPLAADALMRTPLPEEKGRSPADLLRRGRFDRALHYAATAGGDR